MKLEQEVKEFRDNKNISMIKRILAGDVVDKLESEAKPHLVVVEDENE